MRGLANGALAQKRLPSGCPRAITLDSMRTLRFAEATCGPAATCPCLGRADAGGYLLSGCMRACAGSRMMIMIPASYRDKGYI